MSGLFGGGGGSKPEPPRVVRMPVVSDPSVQAASQRAKNVARQRSGRLSTILSNPLRTVNGSQGRLGS